MHRARPLLVRLTVFAAVIAPVLAFASIAAQSPAEPKSIIKGVVRYERRGVSGAPPTGIVTGVMMGGATAVGMQRAVKGVLGLLAGAAALTGNPSITEMNDFLRSTDQIDMSGWPVKAEYGA
ncbi:MAG: hypothetical protein H0T68_01955, partial [Gemmatimonadales bacterium]|nr:hypothetical protein [Gemmatimonadales bacterium]